MRSLTHILLCFTIQYGATWCHMYPYGAIAWGHLGHMVAHHHDAIWVISTRSVQMGPCDAIWEHVVPTCGHIGHTGPYWATLASVCPYDVKYCLLTKSATYSFARASAEIGNMFVHANRYRSRTIFDSANRFRNRKHSCSRELVPKPETCLFARTGDEIGNVFVRANRCRTRKRIIHTCIYIYIYIIKCYS